VREARRQLEITGLNADVLDCQDALRAAVAATRQAVVMTDADLVAVQRSLAANLAMRPEIERLVTDAFATGGSAYATPDEFYDAIAMWIIDLQLADGLLWDATAPIERPQAR
jgi:hypothetical protein